MSELSIVYERSNFYIKDITTFSQYILNLTDNLDDGKLLTIIGERHNLKFNCINTKEPKMIDDYIIEQSKYCKTKLILEMDDPGSIKNINSDNIKKITERLNITDIDVLKNIETVYNDPRVKFLDPIFYGFLYRNKDLSTWSKDLIKEKYIDPFKKMETETKIEEKEYYNDHYKKFCDVYINKLHSDFKHINDGISNYWGNKEMMVTFTNFEGDKITDNITMLLINELKNIWARVSDFFLIAEFFKIDGVKQYIILIGEYHYRNIISYLESIREQNNYIVAKIGDPQNVYVIHNYANIKNNVPINCINVGKGTAVIRKKDSPLSKINVKTIKPLKK